MKKRSKDMREKMQAEREATDKEIEAVLNADQKAKFSQLCAERKARMKHRHERRARRHNRNAIESSNMSE